MKKYSVDWFINKFYNIPNYKWRVGTIGEDGSGITCALGHCGGYPSESKESKVLATMFLKLFTETHIDNVKTGAIVFKVNDKALLPLDTPHMSTELGDTPKERVLNALYMIKAGVK